VNILWDRIPNTQLEESAYEDLFATSDAMIFDSISVITEYLYTKKPSLFLYKDTVDGQLNEFGLKALRCHQLGRNRADIVSLIEGLIDGTRDPLAAKKERFFASYLIPAKKIGIHEHLPRNQESFTVIS
jgi:CDP-glycerol glycerophosphotransferase (TagB/SpsB family)